VIRFASTRPPPNIDAARCVLDEDREKIFFVTGVQRSGTLGGEQATICLGFSGSGALNCVSRAGLGWTGPHDQRDPFQTR
jgi:hypothetical protein